MAMEARPAMVKRALAHLTEALAILDRCNEPIAAAHLSGVIDQVAGWAGQPDLAVAGAVSPAGPGGDLSAPG
jgi:hypothetical protein